MKYVEIRVYSKLSGIGITIIAEEPLNDEIIKKVKTLMRVYDGLKITNIPNLAFSTAHFITQKL